MKLRDEVEAKTIADRLISSLRGVSLTQEQSALILLQLAKELWIITTP